MNFKQIPQTRVPGQYAEIETSRLKAGLSTLDYKTLLIGQGTDDGSASAKELRLLSSADQAGVLFGTGSLLHLMARRYFQNNNTNECKAIAVTMDPLATPTGKAAGSLEILAGATAAGAVFLYISGQRIAANILKDDTAEEIATAIKAAIDLLPNLPVQTERSTATLDFEAKNVGEVGNYIDIRLNMHEGEEVPEGVTYTLISMTGGTGNPSIADGSPSVIDTLGDIWFQILAFPYTDATNLGAIEEELDRRFGPTTQIDGLAITALSASVDTLQAFGADMNTKQLCIMGMEDVPEQPGEVAATIVGQVAGSLAAGNGAEAVPFQTLPLIGIHAPRESNRFTFIEQDTLLKNGIGTFYTDAGGIVRIQRLITTYQTNEQGAPDVTWLDANTRFTAMFIRYDWVNYLRSKYPRAKLAGDGVRVGSGQIVITPKIARAEAIARFTIWELAGLVEDFEFFKANLIAERDESDSNAMNWFLPADFVNQFLIGKTQIGVIV